MEEMTFAMIKPDATARNLIGAIIQKLESRGLKMQEGRLMKMSESVCRTFYQEHKEKPFFNSLVEFMLSGPVFIMALSGINAVAKTRKIMGIRILPKPKKALFALYMERV